MGTPLVSVIVPNYNHARFLRRRIDTILAQTFRDFELILLDDCSTDESRAVLQEYAADPHVTHTEFNEKNSGTPFAQWNKGVRLARGKYVWIAESDDYADPRFLERLCAALDCDPRVTLAYCRSQCISAEDEPVAFADMVYFQNFDPDCWASDFCTEGREECCRHLIRYNTVPNASSVVFRREIWERAGGADETLHLCGDWKLWAAIALEGKVAYVSQPLSFYRVHERSVTRTVDTARVHVAEWLHVIRWMLKRVAPPTNMLEAVRRDQVMRWVPVVVSFRVPLDVKLGILRDARAIDPHMVRRAVRPVLVAVGLKIRRHWREIRSAFAPVRT